MTLTGAIILSILVAQIYGNSVAMTAMVHYYYIAGVT